jgi:hypothetical protein
MGSIGKSIVLVFILFFLTSLVTLQPLTVKAASLEADNKYFPLPDENATIILLNGTSYYQSTYYPAPNGTVGVFVADSWDFLVLSTGNGSIDLDISAHDCNLTITSVYSYEQNIGGYFADTYMWLNYTITGTGTQYLSSPSFYNSNNTNPTVYIDGTIRQQGDGWNWANYGITVSGARSNVSIYQESSYSEPPRLPLPRISFDLLGTIAVIAIIIVVISLITGILLFYRRHQRTA